MTPTNTAVLAKRLAAVFTNSPIILPVWSPDRPLIEPFGAAYYVIPSQIHRRLDDLWFWDLLPAKRLKTQHGSVYCLVNWKLLLGQGVINQDNRLIRLAHDILGFLVPVIDQYDVALAEDLRWMLSRRAAFGREYLEDHPLEYGQGGEDFVNRFNAHLSALLDRKAFLTNAQRSLEKTFKYALFKMRVKPSKRGIYEPTLLDNITAFEAHKLKNPTPGYYHLDIPRNYCEIKDPWTMEIRRLTESLVLSDGAIPILNRGAEGDSVLVDWSRVLRNIREQDRFSPFNFLWKNSDYRGDLETGLEAAKMCEALYGARILAPGVGPFRESVAPGYQGCVLYRVSELQRILREYQLRATVGRENLKHIKRNTPPRGNRKYRILDYNDYKTTEGDTAFIQITIRGGELLCTTPYGVPEAYEEQENRTHRGYSICGRIFWNIRGLNMHAMGVNNGTLSIGGIPEAEPFRQHMEVVFARLRLAGEFTKALFDQNLGNRIREKIAGKREHIGPFTAVEDDAIRQWCEARGRAGHLTEAEHKELTELCVARSKAAILRRRADLGLEYAMRHGWAAYARSGYCSNKTTPRREKWRTEYGVRL